MSDFLPSDVREALAAAQTSQRRKSSRLRVRCGDQEVTVLRSWPGGFSVDLSEAEGLHGLVDLYEGGKHLSVCLIIASSDEGGERRFDYKRQTPTRDKAPLDFARTAEAPAGYLPAPDAQTSA